MILDKFKQILHTSYCIFQLYFYLIDQFRYSVRVLTSGIRFRGEFRFVFWFLCLLLSLTLFVIGRFV